MPSIRIPSLPRPGRRRALALLAGAAVAGPARAAAPPAPLTVAAFPLLDEIVRRAEPRWRALHPELPLRVISRQYADHHTAMTTALSTASYLPDVMAFEVSFLGRFAQGGGLQDLRDPRFGIEQHRARWVPFAYDQAIGRGGGVMAAPSDVGPGTMLVRIDILERAGVAIEDLTRSWESYVEAGRRIKARTGAYLVSHVQAVKDIVARTGIEPGDSMYYRADGHAAVTSRRFVRAFEVAREIRRAGLDAQVATWSNDWSATLRRGTLATELGGAWLVGMLNKWVAPETAGLWRAAQLPEATFTGYGGAFYAMPRRLAPERQALAWDLIRMLTLDRQQQFEAFRDYDAFPSLLETFDDPFFEQPLPFLGGQRARLLWREAARRIPPVRVHKQNNFADEVISTELDLVTQHGKDIGTALADAAGLVERRGSR